eukprot:CAMPEP_0201945620 /NCGR_PEP_ID=MMETSP0903-20130614/53995_1 /ASSEMBLY_ACC=CAM_ASM_000552 /TAXON_ID=420261 /ORGANISM="Thalassiosira antarctica, Strain CCMP982" /LENGTH=65 /DNA_ID=CAMNT_0048488689 /DNA_START=204 /DNA_END=401 /DNA_ORIENTATION=-
MSSPAIVACAAAFSPADGLPRRRRRRQHDLEVLDPFWYGSSSGDVFIEVHCSYDNPEVPYMSESF